VKYYKASGKTPTATACRTSILFGITLMIGGSAIAAPGDLLQTINNPAPQADARFGQAVGSSGGHILIGAPFHDSISAVDAGIVYRYDRFQNLVHEMKDDTVVDGAQFGTSVEAYGANAMIGAPFDSSPGASAGGSVNLALGSNGAVYREYGSPMPVNGARYGWSTAFSSLGLLVGAPNANALGVNDSGVVFVQPPNRAGASAMRRLGPRSVYVSPFAATGDLFGWSLSSRNNIVAIGAPGTDTAETSNTGAVIVYGGKTAKVLHALRNPAPQENGEFGYALALIEDERRPPDNNFAPQLAIGAPGTETDFAASAGIVYVYDSQTGNLQFTLRNPAPTSGARFGAAIANVDGNIVVGAPGHNNNTGIAYLFDGQTGLLKATLAANSAEGDQFGASVTDVFFYTRGRAFDVNVAVGAPGRNVATRANAGAVYLFEGVE